MGYLARFSIYPPNIEYKNGIRFTNQRRRGDKKEDRRPEEGHGQKDDGGEEGGSIRRRKTEQELWYPNAEAPAWLDGSMPGDRGFDPFGLAKPVEYLQFDLDKLDNSAAVNPSGNVIGKVKRGDNKPTERTIVPFNEAFDINRFRECELLHSRWAMLGITGIAF